MKSRIGCMALAGLAWGTVAATAPAANAPPIVVMNNLSNPRGLAVGPDGAVYVAEAGRGGTGPCVVTTREGSESTACIGASGAVSRYLGGKQDRVLTGLPSVAGADGSGSTGPHDVAVLDNGNLDVVVGLGYDPAKRANFGADGANLGSLHEFALDGTKKGSVDLSAFETANNPAGGPVDSNPYGIFLDSQGALVTDAGGNGLLRVGAGGAVSSVAAFASRTAPFMGNPIPMEPVPTSVTEAADGTIYVGELTGFPFPVGGAQIYKITPGQAPVVFQTGFTNIIDLATGPDGSLYVLEMRRNGQLSADPNGTLTRIAADGTKTVFASDGLIFPSSVAVTKDGKIYLSLNGVSPDAGQVVILPQPTDVNKDGKVDLEDARTGLRALVGAVTLTAEQLTAADVNGNGRVDLADLRYLILQSISG